MGKDGNVGHRVTHIGLHMLNQLMRALHRPVIGDEHVKRDEAPRPGLARAFFELVLSPAGKTVLARHGFQ